MEKHKAKVTQENCLMCGGCIAVCPQDAIEMRDYHAFVLEEKCIGCGICIKACPVGAIGEVGV